MRTTESPIQCQISDRKGQSCKDGRASDKQHIGLFFGSLRPSTSTLSPISIWILTLTVSSPSSSSSTVKIVSSTSPSTRLQWLSYAYFPISVSSLSLRVGAHTCSLPFSSRSPRSRTNTISSRDNRTRSRGSDTAVAASSVESAMVLGENCGRRRGQLLNGCF